MWSADLVQTNGLGSSFRVLTQVRTSFFSACKDLYTSRRSRVSVTIEVFFEVVGGHGQSDFPRRTSIRAGTPPGVERLAVVNGHGGNYVLASVVQQANTAGPRMTLFPSRED